MKWHEDINKRIAIGDEAEDEFPEVYACHCGKGTFQFIGTATLPDFTCDHCGQLVDVKNSPRALETKRLPISQIPFNHYANDLIIALRLAPGIWSGCYRSDAIFEGPYPPRHKERGTHWYMISLENWQPLWDILKLRDEDATSS